MRARPLLAALATAAVLVAGCGSGTAPAEDVPALATALDDVDAAVVSGDDTAVRDAVDALTEVTTRAREAGDLDAAAADRILAAAEELLAALQEATPPTEDESSEPPTPVAPTSTPAPTTPEPTSEDDDEGEGEGEGKSEDKGKSDDKGKSEQKDKDEKDD